MRSAENTIWKSLTAKALRGKMGDLVEKRRCRRHYGVSLAQPFNPGLDGPRDIHVWEDPFQKTLYRSGWMKWSIKKVPTSTLCPIFG